MQVMPPRPAILVIDDDSFVTEPLKLSLAGLGYRSLSAESAVTGLAVAVKHRPRAILLDLNMPEMDGFEFLIKRHKVAELRDVPVIVLTASQAHEDVRRAIALGAADYLVKPVDETKLATHLARLVPSPFYTPATDSAVAWSLPSAIKS